MCHNISNIYKILHNQAQFLLSAVSSGWLPELQLLIIVKLNKVIGLALKTQNEVFWRYEPHWWVLHWIPGHGETQGEKLWFSAGFTRRAELLSYLRRSSAKRLAIDYPLDSFRRKQLHPPSASSVLPAASPAAQRGSQSWPTGPSPAGVGWEPHRSLPQNPTHKPRWQPQPWPCPAPATPRGDEAPWMLQRGTGGKKGRSCRFPVNTRTCLDPNLSRRPFTVSSCKWLCLQDTEE